jgi:hypothetical protein
MRDLSVSIHDTDLSYLLTGQVALQHLARASAAPAAPLSPSFATSPLLASLFSPMLTPGHPPPLLHTLPFCLMLVYLPAPLFSTKDA